MNRATHPAAGQPGGQRLRIVWLERGLGAWFALCLASLLSLGGCSRENAAQQQAQVLLHSGVATGMRPNVLMDAAFGAENELIEPGAVYWQVVLPLPQPLTPAQYQEQIARAIAQDKAALAIASDRVENRLMAVRPREAVRLNDTQVALVVESVALSDLPARSRQQAASGQGAAADIAADVAAGVADAPGQPTPQQIAQQAVPMHLGVIFFQAENDAALPGNSPPDAGAETWRAARLTPHVDYWMTGPVPPEVQVYKLDASRYLVTYTQTDCRAGACSRWLKGYLLQPDSMKAVFATRLAASNAWQHADCTARLGLATAAQPVQAAASGLAATVASLHGHESESALPQLGALQASAASAAPAQGEAASGHACHVVDGEVHLLSRGRADTADVQIRYTGVVSDAPGKLRTIAQTQRFRLNGMQLEQIAGGASPVPAHEP